jgi:hypothetical protein
MGKVSADYLPVDQRAAGMLLALTLRRPGKADIESAGVESGAARALWALPAMRTLCGRFEVSE